MRYKELYFGCNYYILITFDSKIMKINTGKNIDESMAFLIKEIIRKLEEINSKGNADFIKSRGSLNLDPDKHNKEADQKRKKENSGCC